ncbi:hypothetical protein HNQ53_003557 [Microbulbifer hydrolyticus]|uniref:Uncharacterized protein n=1 Tax=Microbulbifer hydrolyticus TaxID=48074 RepID=A0AA89PG50_9GAMM|nr:hypothetical protein [Microbulbifer hydrolyticus]
MIAHTHGLKNLEWQFSSTFKKLDPKSKLEINVLRLRGLFEVWMHGEYQAEVFGSNVWLLTISYGSRAMRSNVFLTITGSKAAALRASAGRLTLRFSRPCCGR